MHISDDFCVLCKHSHVVATNMATATAKMKSPMMIIVIQNITANTLQQKNQIIAVYSKQRNQQIYNHIL